MKRIGLSMVAVLLGLMCAINTFVAAADMTGHFKTTDTAFIQEIEIKDDHVKLYILPNWTEEHALEWHEMMHLKTDTTALIQPEDEGDSPYRLDYQQVLNEVLSQLDEDVTYEELDVMIELQVPGIYLHSEDIERPYFLLTQTEVVKSGDYLYIKLLKDDLLSIKVEDDQTLSYKEITYTLE